MAAKTDRLHLMEGILPVERRRIGADVAAGLTLAALGIPEVMGYTSIAGMPVVTGLYTILIPLALFAILASSRHLVVGADSATAAIMAAGLAGMASTGSSQYVALAGALAIVTGVLLIGARLIRLGFIADFLSRSVLIGFLTGVGIQVALDQVGDMLGVPAQSGGTLQKFFATLGAIGESNGATIVVSVAVIAVIFIAKAISPRIPGALIAVVGAIFASWTLDLSADGVATLGQVPGGLPAFGVPDVQWSTLSALLPTAGAMFIVIIAQSAATSRAYAAKYEEEFDENVDLVGLGLANVSAGLTGAFVVNGSPTKTQMVDGAGGRSQLAMLTTALIVLIVLLFLTAPLEYMPSAVLASVVFIIGLELIDLVGMRNVLIRRRDEFVIALLTAGTVVIVGVEQAIVLAVFVSAINHLRFSYRPRNSVVVIDADGRHESVPADPGAQTEPGLVVYRFSSGLYYANAGFFNEQILGLIDGADPPVTDFVLDASAMVDIDFSGGSTFTQLLDELDDRGVRLLVAHASVPVRHQLDRYGVTSRIGTGRFFDSVKDAVAAAKGATSSDGF